MAARQSGRLSHRNVSEDHDTVTVTRDESAENGRTVKMEHWYGGSEVWRASCVLCRIRMKRTTLSRAHVR
jgi:hypothetical protein